MIEPDLNAREYVTEICRRMPVGRHELLTSDLVAAAWPATGEQDDRATSLGVTVGEFGSLAAAVAGNRPIGGETTLAGLQAALGGEFEVRYRPEELAFDIYRVKDNQAKPAVRARASLPRFSDWSR